MNPFLFFAVIFFFLSQAFSENSPSPQQVQQEIDQAERTFKKAEKMFNPWYAGPLLTGSANVAPMGSIVLQPYVFVTNHYARFNSRRDSICLPDLVQVNTPFILQTGLLPRVDITVTPQYIYNHQNAISYNGIGDTSLALGISLFQETPYIPAMKVGITESFPTGKYENLSSNKNGLDALGSGSYATTFSFNVSKVIWWSLLHPTRLRLSLNYKVSSKVEVEELNAYGGGNGTKGKVKPGDSFTTNFAFEYSLNQKWVFATDFSYVCSKKTRFRGTLGTSATGEAASVGAPDSDQLSLAPALEYLFTPNIGILAGGWFSVYGKNSFHFASGVLTVTALF